MTVIMMEMYELSQPQRGGDANIYTRGVRKDFTEAVIFKLGFKG